MKDDLGIWLGRYAMELRVASTAKLPLLPSDRSATVSLLLVDIQRGRGGALTQRHQVCDVRVENSSAMQTRVPAAFVRSLGPRAYAVDLHPARRSWRYVADMGLEAIGFDPRLSGGQLPTGPDDPVAVDTDGDGNPGATIELRVPLMGRARLFIAQRTHLVLRAEAETPERIEGAVEIRLLEQRTLGADPGYFSRTPDLRPDPRRSRFTMVRLPDDAGCTELQQHAASLFDRSSSAR